MFTIIPLVRLSFPVWKLLLLTIDLQSEVAQLCVIIIIIIIIISTLNCLSPPIPLYTSTTVLNQLSFWQCISFQRGHVLCFVSVTAGYFPAVS